MRRNTKEMLNDMDYISKMSKADRKWLYKAVSGITNANVKTLTELEPTKKRPADVQEDCEDARNSYRRDIMNLGKRIGDGSFFDSEPANSLPLITEEITMGSFEDAMIEKIDNERVGKAYTAGSYGNNSDVPVGADVVVCIEGHQLQNRLGKVIGTRCNQLLVLVQTTKGEVSLYVSPYEVARVNQAKKVC